VKYATHPTNFSNGRYVRNIIEKSIRAQAMRLLLSDKFGKEDLLLVKEEDLILNV
jgi:stage V sporulation protein K